MSERVVKGEPVGRVGCERIEHPGVPAGELVLPMPGSGKPNPYQLLPLLHSYTLNPPWKVDRVLANQSLLLTAGTPSNIPFAWFLVLGCNRQAWVSIANSAWWWKSDTRGKQGKGMVEGREGLGVTSERV